ncbi:Crp/Fnr family transcriptional regulator [Bacillus timonensis]|nr:Crp/Fnr family transcriptional regulator [Bacillus timonensis]
MTVAFQLSENESPLQVVYNLAKTTRKVKKGELIFFEGQEASEIYLIKTGLVRLCKQHSNGMELNLRICKTNDLIGELILFTDNPSYFLTAQAMTPVEVYVINKDLVEKAVYTNPSVAKDFIVWFNTHFRKTQTKFRDLVLYGKKGAVYSTLIRMTNSYGKTMSDGSILIDLKLSNQELANFCGGTRESVNRMLSELKDLGVVSVKSGFITIHNLDFLKQEIQCEGCPKEICCIE